MLNLSFLRFLVVQVLGRLPVHPFHTLADVALELSGWHIFIEHLLDLFKTPTPDFRDEEIDEKKCDHTGGKPDKSFEYC